MASEGFPRFPWNAVELGVDVEHEGGVGQVLATFRHDEWPTVAIECYTSLRANFLGSYPRRVHVVLRNRRPMYQGNAGTYRLERLIVRNGRGDHEVAPLPRLGFHVEEDPNLPEHERNVSRFLQGEEVSLKVEASHRDGVWEVRVRATGGYGGNHRGETIEFYGEGDGSERCEVLLKGRIKDSRRVGRYRAQSMKVFPPYRAVSRRFEDGGRTQPLHPPLVFEVLKNEHTPPPPAEPPKNPNWGFSERGDQAGPAD